MKKPSRRSWIRCYKSDTHDIYVYFDRDNVESFKTIFYNMYPRYYIGEDAMQKTIQLVKDLGDNALNESLIKEIQEGIRI